MPNKKLEKNNDIKKIIDKLSSNIDNKNDTFIEDFEKLQNKKFEQLEKELNKKFIELEASKRISKEFDSRIKLLNKKTKKPKKKKRKNNQHKL